ncbi:GIY-YIG nuclease family protein [Chryseobacterium sp. JK1]|uniref:GIY-YIG nuclease family protein n=1 Tax=Chryseobacterium sp. JK1 TaxID=874294 RepID=UPI003D69076A
MKNALKQQLREKAKNHTVTMGVLSLKNNSNGKQYIQSSLNLEALVNRIQFELSSGLFNNTALQKDWTASGSEAFTFEFVTIIPKQENSFINYRKEIQKAEKAYASEVNTELY